MRRSEGHVGSKKRPKRAQDPFLKDLPRDLHILEIHEPFQGTLDGGRPWSRRGVRERSGDHLGSKLKTLRGGLGET